MSDDLVLDTMVRDFTALGRCSKSEVRRRITEYVEQKIRMERESIVEQGISIVIPPRHGH